MGDVTGRILAFPPPVARRRPIAKLFAIRDALVTALTCIEAEIEIAEHRESTSRRRRKAARRA